MIDLPPDPRAQTYAETGVWGRVTLDAYRVGAHEQLRTYGRILGVPVHTAHDRASLEDLLELLAGKKMVLIDSAGMAQRDSRTRELLEMLSHRSINRLLVVNASAQGETVEEVIGAYNAAVLEAVRDAAERISGDVIVQPMVRGGAELFAGALKGIWAQDLTIRMGQETTFEAASDKPALGIKQFDALRFSTAFGKSFSVEPAAVGTPELFSLNVRAPGAAGAAALLARLPG